MTGNAATAAPGRDERLPKGFIVPDAGRRESLPALRRRESRHQEWVEQAKPIGLFKELLPARTFFTALENRPRSAFAGRAQRRLGVRPGLTDLLIVVRGMPPIFLEMKSPRGLASASQKQIRAELLAADAVWIMARTANAALVVLQRVGVQFCRPWDPPQPAAWEGPFFDPHRRLPQEPGVAAERRATLRAWRERQRARKGAQALAANRTAGVGDAKAQPRSARPSVRDSRDRLGDQPEAACGLDPKFLHRLVDGGLFVGRDDPDPTL